MLNNIYTESLVRSLERQYFAGVATCGPCPICQKSSRGSDFCKTCIITELRSRGISGAAIHHFCQMQNRKINIIEKIEAARAVLLEG